MTKPNLPYIYCLFQKHICLPGTAVFTYGQIVFCARHNIKKALHICLEKYQAKKNKTFSLLKKLP